MTDYNDNNVWGSEPNNCPARMNYSIGLTDYTPKNEAFNRDMNKLGNPNIHEYKKMLKVEDFQEIVNSFQCSVKPTDSDNNIENIRVGNILASNTSGGNWRDQISKQLKGGN